jgi:hypothetical protein
MGSLEWGDTSRCVCEAHTLDVDNVSALARRERQRYEPIDDIDDRAAHLLGTLTDSGAGAARAAALRARRRHR